MEERDNRPWVCLSVGGGGSEAVNQFKAVVTRS